MTTEQKLISAVGYLTDMVNDLQFYGVSIDEKRFNEQKDHVKKLLHSCIDFSDEIVIPENKRIIIVDGIKFSRELFSSVANIANIGMEFKIAENENHVVTIVRCKE